MNEKNNGFEVEISKPKKELAGVKAFANIKIKLDIGTMVVKDFAIRVSGKDGSLWVSAPSKKGKDKDGNEKYFESVHMLSKEGRANLHEVILAAYSQVTGEKRDVAPPSEDEVPSFT